MKSIDKNAKRNIARYIFQCGIATAAILLILIFLDVLTHTAIIAALGATAFIVFTMPRAYSSGPRPLIGGYLIGIIVGCGCSLLSTLRFMLPFFITRITSYTVFGALAVGIAIFLMAVTNTEHAPAAGISLELVLNDGDYSTVLFIFTAVLFMTGLRRLLGSILIDLRDICGQIRRGNMFFVVVVQKSIYRMKLIVKPPSLERDSKRRLKTCAAL